MKILVTGGAGYIGSAQVKTLCDAGHEVTVVDNMSKGMLKLVDKRAKLIECDLKNLEHAQADAVMHFASYKAAGESMENPEKYSDNITGTINLLNLMVKNNIKKIIHSSTAAVYGNPEYSPLDENHPTNPINYYGYTKLVSEKLIEWYAKHNINFIHLRYFNVAGDAGFNYVDPEANNIFPIIMEVIKGKRDKLVIFGNNYETRDGTCIRDYIDINDLIRAHTLALEKDFTGTINLGSGTGVSVKELVEKTIEITGNFNWEFGDRREGDPAELVASNAKAKEILDWQPEKDIKDMIKTTFDAYSNL